MHFGCCRCSALDGFRSSESWRFRSPHPWAWWGRRQRERHCWYRSRGIRSVGGRRRGELWGPADPRLYLHGVANPRHDSRPFRHSPGAACRVRGECAGRRWSFARKGECQSAAAPPCVRGRPAPRGARRNPCERVLSAEHPTRSAVRQPPKRVAPRVLPRRQRRQQQLATDGAPAQISRLAVADLSLPAGQYRPEAFYRRRKPVNRIPKLPAWLGCLQARWVIGRVKQALRELRADLVHAHSFDADLIALRACAGPRSPSSLPARATRISTGPCVTRIIIADGRAPSEPSCRSPDRWRKTCRVCPHSRDHI